jgi:hypothetical protein
MRKIAYEITNNGGTTGETAGPAEDCRQADE